MEEQIKVLAEHLEWPKYIPSPSTVVDLSTNIPQQNKIASKSIASPIKCLTWKEDLQYIQRPKLIQCSLSAYTKMLIPSTIRAAVSEWKQHHNQT